MKKDIYTIQLEIARSRYDDYLSHKDGHAFPTYRQNSPSRFGQLHLPVRFLLPYYFLLKFAFILPSLITLLNMGVRYPFLQDSGIVIVVAHPADDAFFFRPTKSTIRSRAPSSALGERRCTATSPGAMYLQPISFLFHFL